MNFKKNKENIKKEYYNHGERMNERGKKKIIRKELHHLLKNGFRVKDIHS
ncbi:hypothetical protein [Blattabacterium sp. (Cryptocercus kyebangensis)]|nr:hypothetical protein [Blattabacterium sp. (Cryptocercus kyebangensis)]